MSLFITFEGVGKVSEILLISPFYKGGQTSQSSKEIIRIMTTPYFEKGRKEKGF